MSVTVSRLDSSTKIGACCSSLDAAEIAVNCCVERRPRRMRLPSISASIDTRRCTTCISLISIEKNAQVFRCATAACSTMFSARLVLPRPGRPAIRIRSEGCRPPVFLSTDSIPVRDEVRLHVRESDLLASLRDAGDRCEHDAVLLARQVRGPKASPRDLVIEGAVHEHRAEERSFGFGLLGRRLDAAVGLHRHAGGPPSSEALEKNFACSLSKRSWNPPVGPLRFFATAPLMRRGAPAGVASRSRHSM